MKFCPNNNFFTKKTGLHKETGFRVQGTQTGYTRRLLFYRTHRQTTDDELRHEAVEDDDRYQRDCDTKVDSTVLCTVDVTTEHLYQHRQGVFFSLGQQYEWSHEVVPACNKGEDCLGSKSRLNDRNDDSVENQEFSSTVNAGCFYQFKGQN